MEKMLSSNEKVRRAEEIYARRQNARERTKRATVNVSEPKNFKLLKRIILQLIICTLIYCIFYLINTTNYSFSKVALEQTDNLLSVDADFAGIYNNVSEKIKGYFEFLKPAEKVPEEDKTTQDNINGENQTSGIQNEVVEQAKEENEVGSIQSNDENTGEESLRDVNISETDRIKMDYSFILPLTRKNNIRIWRKRKYFKHCIYIS